MSKEREAYERTVKRVVEHNKAQGKPGGEAQARRDIGAIANRRDNEASAGLHAEKPKATVKPIVRTVRAIYNVDPKALEESKKGKG